ncbi:hypothetical protein [Micrococcus luteus]|uniref:hypothetical protein n=1 Tax=Micrococcus luteus TaxID=1270 RepID=UPI0015D7B432|nr:hypothetical protein [Micrococcus luteus]
MRHPTPAPSRRAVVAGLAWSTPVAAASLAAPAFAISSRCLTSTTATWNDASRYVRSSPTTGVYTFPDPDGTGPLQGMRLTVSTSLGSNTRTGNQAATVNDNLRALGGATIGGAASPLKLHQAPISNSNKTNTLSDANKSVTTFTFSRQVTSLSFTITDIDSASNDFWDAVAVTSPTAYTSAKTSSTQVTGAGTVTNPWQAANSNTPIPDSSTAGNVKVTFSAPLTTFAIHYWNRTALSSSSIDGDQGIFISNLQLTYNACPA